MEPVDWLPKNQLVPRYIFVAEYKRFESVELSWIEWYKKLSRFQRRWILENILKNDNCVGLTNMRGQFFIQISEKVKISIAVNLTLISIKPTQFKPT